MTKDLSNRYLNGNMHPVDALASVREQITELKKIEAELRDQVLESPKDRRGQIYIAEVLLGSQKRICQEKIKKLLGSVDVVKKNVDVTTVRVFKLEQDQ